MYEAGYQIDLAQCRLNFPGAQCAAMARMLRIVRGVVLLATFVALGASGFSARAADARRGQRLALEHCASCHIVVPHGREEVADSPPFEAIGRKYGFDAAAIAHVIAGPHRKMNFAPDPKNAADIAAYIATLGP